MFGTGCVPGLDGLAREGMGRNICKHSRKGHAAGDQPAIDMSELAQCCVTCTGGSCVRSLKAHVSGGEGCEREATG